MEHIAAIARPGDTVLIGFAHELTAEDIEALDESFRPLAELGLKVGFTDNVTSMVVFRPGEEALMGHERTDDNAGNDIPETQRHDRVVHRDHTTDEDES